MPHARADVQNGGWVRVPLRLKGGNLTAQWWLIVSRLLAGMRPRSRWSWVGALSCVVDGVYWALLAWALHLPLSAVPLVSDVRFCRST
jgi:hypothetical protein